MEKDIELVEARWFAGQFSRGMMNAEEVIHSVLMTPQQRDYLIQESAGEAGEIIDMFRSRMNIIRTLLKDRKLSYRVMPKSKAFPSNRTFAWELTQWLMKSAPQLMVGRFALQKNLGSSGGVTYGSGLADGASATDGVCGTALVNA